MEEWSGHNTFAYSLNFDELLQQSHFSSLLWIKIFHFVQRWENVKAITLYQNLNFVKKVDTSLFCHLSSWSCFFPVVVLGRGRGASAPSLFVQPPPQFFYRLLIIAPPHSVVRGPLPRVFWLELPLFLSRRLVLLTCTYCLQWWCYGLVVSSGWLQCQDHYISLPVYRHIHY